MTPRVRVCVGVCCGRSEASARAHCVLRHSRGGCVLTLPVMRKKGKASSRVAARLGAPSRVFARRPRVVVDITARRRLGCAAVVGQAISAIDRRSSTVGKSGVVCHLSPVGGVVDRHTIGRWSPGSAVPLPWA